MPPAPPVMTICLPSMPPNVMPMMLSLVTAWPVTQALAVIDEKIMLTKRPQ
jgi:hypothetical protein